MSQAVHRQTPTLSVVDPRGLAVRTVRYGRTSVGAAADTRVSHTVLDAAGRPVAQRDPRLFALAEHDDTVPANVTTIYNLSGQTLANESTDAGRRVVLFGDAGQALQTWDGETGEGALRRTTYDALLRPMAVYEQTGEEPERCAERFTYAGPEETEAARNRCGRLVRHDDPAGTLMVPAYSLHGQAQGQARRFLDTLDSPDWPEDSANADALLELGKDFITTWTHDALGGVLSQTDAEGHAQDIVYDVAGQLRQATLTLAGCTSQMLLHRLDYSATGQMLTQTSGNDVVTVFTYDPADGRLRRCTATRTGDSKVLQDVHTAYDPVGNAVRIEDVTQPVRYFKNRRINAVSTYAYDSLYQLVQATGRESATTRIGPALPTLQPLDAELTPYTQTYAYDAGGNLTQLCHQGTHPHTQTMAVAPIGNRALPWKKGQPPPDWARAFDTYGNLRALSPCGQALVWNARRQLRQVTALVRTDGGDNDTEVYVYDSAGQRVRKVSTAYAKTVTRTREVRYFPGLELRTDSASGEQLAVITAAGMRMLHWTTGRPTNIPNDQARYTLGDHLGSTTLELDASAALISHEGYYPYGGTAWWAGRNNTEANYKTTRYSGKERDATGLYYYGFRYYAPWLNRWLNPDPGGDIDGLNRYWFVRNSPMVLVDPDGSASEIPKEAHYIWLGGNLPDYARSNIIAFKGSNPDWNVNLWTDNPGRLASTLTSEGASTEMLKRINIRDIDEAMGSVPAYLRRDFSGAYTREVSGPYRNYAAASDLLRLAILLEHGGLYMDTDVYVDPSKSIGRIQAFKSPSASVLFIKSKDRSEGNFVMAGERGAKEMRMMLSRAIDSYVRDINELKGKGGYFAAAHSDENYRASKKKPDALDIEMIWSVKRARQGFFGRRDLTISMTGPAILNEFLFNIKARDSSRYRIQSSDAFGIAREMSPGNTSRSWLAQVRPAGEWTRPNWRPRRASAPW